MMRAWVVAVVVAAAVAGGDARALCPPRCHCDDALLEASCAGAALDVVPIQLNPDAERINLTRNRIANVHFTLGFYARLRTLDLSHNAIEALGARNFDNNDRLERLNLSRNSVHALDKHAFTGLRNLHLLDISANKLADIDPTAFRDLASLETLDLSQNFITTFQPDTFKPLTKLTTLLLNSNQLLEIPSENLVFTVHLEHLSLSSNLIIEIKDEAFISLRKLRTLNLDKNVLNSLSHSSFDGLSYLHHLDLSVNNLTSVPTNTLSKLSNLSHLSLSGNSFTSIPAVSFQSLFRLRYLHLSNLDEITHIDARAFVDNINLERIWLNDNIRIENIPTRIFHGNPRLTHVSIKNNALVTLEASHFPLDQLYYLQISGNPLICNCSLLWLWQLSQKQRLRKPTLNNTYTEEPSPLLIDFQEISCSQPEKLQNMLLTNVPESEIHCSFGWVTLVTIVLTISVTISVSGSIFYYIKCNRQDTKCVIANNDLTSDLPKMSNGLVYGTAHRRPTDNKVELDRYLVIGQPMRNNFNTLGNQWHHSDKSVYQDDHMENMYQQFGYETIPHHKTLEKPHIVYV